MPESHDVSVAGELSVEIDVSRWDVTITIVDAYGSKLVYIVSADSELTQHDRIWFGTEDECREALQ